MKEFLYNKIITLKKIPFLEDLSSYSLAILAYNVNVKQYKYGDIIIK